MRNWVDHFDVFGLKPCEEGTTPFQRMEHIYRTTKELEFENDTRESYKINAEIEADEWGFMLEVVRDLKSDCMAQYNHTHDKRLIEVVKLCEEEMKTAKSRLYALKWLLAD